MSNEDKLDAISVKLSEIKSIICLLDSCATEDPVSGAIGAIEDLVEATQELVGT